MVGCLVMEGNWGRERALIAELRQEKLPQAFGGNVGEAGKRISRCCFYSVSWSELSAFEQIQFG